MYEMPSSPATTDAWAFKQTDASSYDPVVDEFERFTNRFSRPFAELLVSLAEISESDKVLDVGAGTGVVTFCVADRLKSGMVVGIDLSDGMLAKASEKAVAQKRCCRVDFRKMDAESLSLDDGAFDAVVSLYALLHFPHPENALAEMYRVLRIGGRLAIGIGSRPALFSRAGFEHYLGKLREIWLRASGRYLTAPKSLNDLVDARFPTSARTEEAPLASAGKNRSRVVPELVRRAGFVNVRTEWNGCDTVIDSPQDFWDLQVTFSSIARKRLSQVSADSLQCLKNEFLVKCSDVQHRGGKLVYPHAAFCIVAQKPNR
jgi:ubiquinone/menaquinone biosynthesis C-methylase UbiE